MDVVITPEITPTFDSDRTALPELYCSICSRLASTNTRHYWYMGPSYYFHRYCWYYYLYIYP